MSEEQDEDALADRLERPDSPPLSGISMASDRSKGDMPSFRDSKPGLERPDSPPLSGISMASDRSKGDMPSFGDQKPRLERPDSPPLSGISMASDRSKGDMPSFGNQKPRLERPDSPPLSGISMGSDRSKGDMPSFGNQKPGYTSSLGREEVPQNISTSASKKIPYHQKNPKYDTETKPQETAGQQKELIPTLKEIFKRSIPDEDKDHPNQGSTEHIMRENKGDKKFFHIKTTVDIFKGKSEQKIRTVLTVGETGIGKSHHAKKFVKEWADSGKSVSNWFTSLWSGAKDDVAIFLLDISKLNSLKGKKFSLVELLCNFYQEIRECEMTEFNKLKVLLILDGLDALEPPLDFKDDIKTLNNIHQAASLNELLTNLIRRSLLPSARLWITSRPSPQLPDKYVNKWTEIRYKRIKHELSADQKKRMISQLENNLKGKQQPGVEIFQIHKDEDREDKIQSLEALFCDSEEKGAQTVLMKGVPNVGKTYLTWSHMMEWAKGESNKNIDFVVSFSFSELNSRSPKNQNMTDLLCQSLNPEKKPGVCNYSECKVLFVLDGLEECELPLNFAQNKDLTDMEETASMDVLLTNLIKGTLFPSAHIWIITQPSGAYKIPSEYIQKVTECRGTAGQQKELIPTLKEIFKRSIPDEDKYHPNQSSTEHIMRENKGDESFSPVETTADIFKGKSEQKIRTVLTVGETGIGKSHHAKKFLKEWAESGKSALNWFTSLWSGGKDDVAIFLLDILKLNSLKGKKFSFVELLCNFFPEMRECEISEFSKLKVLLILDGLDALEPPLDFKDDIKTLNDIHQAASLNELLTNLIRGSLLPSARLWITSRPSAQLLDKCFDRWTEIRYKSIKHELSADQKKRMISQLENNLKGKQQPYTEIFQIHKDKVGEDKIQSLEALFCDSEEKGAQTVLMKGVPNVGKTYLTWSHMMEWAKGESNKNIDFVVSFSFSELNSRSSKNQNMTDLLCQSLNPEKKPGVCNYSECKFLFVLDSLEKCELPLNFAQNKDLTDMEETASMDVLLTNLIKGTLFPSAHIWIITQPSGADKIPSEYIQKVTECRETAGQQKELIPTLKEIFKKSIPDEDKDHPNQSSTEHVMRENKGDEKFFDIKTTADIFKGKSEQKIRTVLTVGEAGIGKSHHAKKFVKEWAESGKSVFNRLKSLWSGGKDDVAIFLLDISELNSLKGAKFSLVELLCNFFPEMRKCEMSKFEKLNVLLILDGLDALEPPLDFKDDTVNDIHQAASVNELLTNLIRGSLLPSARLWITSRPSPQLPDEYVNRWTEIRYGNIKDYLSTNQKERMKSQLEKDLNGKQPYTEIFEIHEDEDREDKIKSLEALFCDSKEKGAQTVLMKGVPNVGKTYLTRSHMMEWAKGKSNKNIDFVVSFSFSELNSRSSNDQNMTDLLCQSLNPEKKPGVCNYSECKFLFVLDGLEKCELPLNFAQNKDLTDMEETASMDVLLTNLIKGTLFPSAHIWIITQPSGAEKIPPKYIQKVTECRETLERRRQLIPTLQAEYKGTIKQKDIDSFKQKYTEHIKTEQKRSGTSVDDDEGKETVATTVTPGTAVSKVSDIFKETTGQKIRNVLTVGVKDVGKTFLVDRFKEEWAKDKSVFSRLADVVNRRTSLGVTILLRLSELNSIRQKKFSLLGLLNHFYKSTSEVVISNFDQLNVLFILDGYDVFQPPLDFKNTETLKDVQKSVSVDVLLTNLIRGSLVPSAQLWITSRPAEASQLPVEYVDRKTEIRYRNIKDYLSTNQKERMKSRLEKDLNGKQQPYTEIFEIHEDEDREDKIQSLEALFCDSKEKGAQTVLMKGVPNVGKTYLTWSHMMEWAKGESNKNIDFVVSFSFSELNSRSSKDQNMTDLLCQSLNPEKKPGVCNYSECKVLFVLDGLEECELPLNFAQNKDLTDMEETASMDVLLTNLIKGTLFPSAHIWIITQPSGAYKIPSEYIQKVTECRETAGQQKKLIPTLKEIFKKSIPDEDKDHPNQSSTEHVMRENKGDEKFFDIKTTADIFKGKSEQKIRTVLTVGEAGIGKSHHAKKFVKEWAESGKSALNWFTSLWSGGKDDVAIFLLDISELNSLKGAKFSLVELLCNFFPEMRKCEMSKFEKLNVLLILDGLDALEPPLDFKDDTVNDIHQTASVNELLTNLIRRSLLPSARLWITSRTSPQLPDEYVNRWTEIRYGNIKDYLSTNQKERMKSQLEKDLNGKQPYTEIFEIHEDEDKEDKNKKIQSLDELFHDSEGKRAQTVLMKGVPNVGKTYLTRSHMMKWAKGESNKNIDFVVAFSFSELNSRSSKDQNMTDLLCQSLNPEKKPGVCNYSECKFLFVLDGLEKCELPLNFAQNKDLTDMEETASMDVLLTNLIKGTLFPSAHIWIITQPSGAEKIPPKYIQKVTECRETLERQGQLIPTLQAEYKGTIKQKDIDSFKQENTEHIKTEQKRSGTSVDDDEGEETVATTVTPVTAVSGVSDIFKETTGQKIRNVLTVGVKDVGKTFLVDRFIEEWAKDKSVFSRLADVVKRRTSLDVIILLRLSELNSIRQKKFSLLGLLNHFYKSTSEVVISNFDQLNVLFILDGFDAFQPPLDFKNTETLKDVQKSVSVDVLLTNLIRGSLVPSAQLWITSRPAEASQLPVEYVDRKTEIRYGNIKDYLSGNQKERTKSQLEKDLNGKQQPYTEIFEIHEDEDREDKIKSLEALFCDSKEKGAQTVLMKGVPNVGKTYLTWSHMMKWAKGESNKNIDFVVSFSFSELNSRSSKDQNMTDLLCKSLNPEKKPGVCNYSECKFLFVLDGLEECELPLNFAQNKDLTDMEGAASMDVLLTNLIKGTLFPSAHIWIITQPSGADKIPSEYIQKVTECRETLERRRQLIPTLQAEYTGTIKQKDIDLLKQKNTEHIKREQKRIFTNVDDDKVEETAATTVAPVTAVSDIFKGSKGQKIRNALTVGKREIGKTFLVEGFIEEWAEGKSVFSWLADASKSRANNDVIILLRVSELYSIRQEKFSLLGVLNHFYQSTSKLVISNFDQLNVLFILDGLDVFQPPLDFENTETLKDVQKSVSVDVLLTNLIRGSLVPSAQLWITSRPAEGSKLPVEYVDRKTEIRYKPDLVSQRDLKSQLKDQFTHVTTGMGMGMQKASATLNDIYTDLYIIEGERGEVNIQSETRQIEGAKFKPEERSIKYDAIFEPQAGKNKDIKSVLTIGMAGIGKSFATMKYMLDWAEDKSHKDIFFMFPLSFRELNLRKDDQHSLEDLIHNFFPGMRTSEIKDYDKYKTLIVLDGFDECRLDLDFKKSDDLTNGSEYTKCVDIKKKSSVKNLLTNLIEGNLLSKAQVWITSRPAASNTIPAEKVDRVTEVRGFNDEQKEEYFKRHFDDEDLAEKILSHVKNSRTLYIMCHIPVFCWLTSKVLEDYVKRKVEGKMPSTLTDMYINFLLLQCRQSNLKYSRDETSEINSDLDSCWNPRNKTIVVSLGKLAFTGLETGDLVFTEETLKDSGIDITEAAVLSGIFTQIKREGPGLHQQKLFCFVHMSIQEFMAAFYVFYIFNNEGENLLTKSSSTMSDFYKTAVDEALRHQNGDWDLFLRFLLGLSLEDNQRLLRALLKKTENNEETNKETIEYIKTKIREESRGADQNFNLFHCLNELNDHSLVDEIKAYLRSETVTFENFTASKWSALTFVLLTSDENLDVFDLKKYRKSEQVLLGMLPVVKVAKTALLSWCELTEESCSGLYSSVLSAPSSNLTELDLSHNDLLDSGVKFITDGLKSLHCKLEILKLSGCQVTETGCSSLALALKSNSASSLKELDLSYNHPGETGETMLTALVEDPDMNLKTLCLEHCGPHRLKPGIKKYDGCLKLDENTASKRLVLSEDNQEVKTVKKVEEKVQRPENEERFKRSQVFCGQGQKGLCYWEVEWRGTVGIAVAYKRVGRKWDSRCGLGCNDMSWSLLCSKDGYTPIHGKPSKLITEPFSQKLAIFLNWNAGTLTYYSDTSGELSHIHTFKATFTEPLYPSFWFKKGCVTLCKIDKTPLRWSQIKPKQSEMKKEAKPVTPKSTQPRVATLNQTSTARVASKSSGSRVVYLKQPQQPERWH